MLLFKATLRVIMSVAGSLTGVIFAVLNGSSGAQDILLLFKVALCVTISVSCPLMGVVFTILNGSLVD